MNPVRLQIGLAVYNGARYLPQTLESILGQSFDGFEIIISDNCSTDATPEICGLYAERDPRIRYFRNEVNIGANPNFNRVFEQSSAPYFSWKAHDDLIAPDFLRRCVEALDNDPAAALAFTDTVMIDDDGAELPFDAAQNCFIKQPEGHPIRSSRLHVAESPDPVERYRDVLHHYDWGHHIYGVIRRDALIGTGLHTHCTGSEVPLLAEIALRGRFVNIDAPLFKRRIHADCAHFMNNGARSEYETAGATSRLAWFMERTRGYAGAVLRAPSLTPTQRARCLNLIARKFASRVA